MYGRIGRELLQPTLETDQHAHTLQVGGELLHPMLETDGMGTPSVPP